jgi:hypothetical protein
MGGVDYTFSCTGTRTVTQSSPPTTVENYSVTINGQVIRSSSHSNLIPQKDDHSSLSRSGR